MKFFSFTPAVLLVTLATAALAQSAPPLAKPSGTVNAPAQDDRSSAYYHYGLAHLYEDAATQNGRTDLANQAIEEYKLALDHDPKSQYLNSGLAELYFKLGRVREAVVAVQDILKKDPDNLEAHKLLGRIYLRSLGDAQNGDQSGEMLNLATGEYVKLVQLEPASTENHVVLGQLYTLAHDTAHAEEQFKLARTLDGDSEDVILNLARLYSERGDTQRSIDTLNSLPADDRSARTEFALGNSYDQLKDAKHAIEAYRRALELESDNLDAERALAQDLLTDGQLDAAMKQYEHIASEDPQDPQSYIRISEIQRRKGQYKEAFATLTKAKALVTDSIELSFNEALLDDSLGRYDQATQVLEHLVADTLHANGEYSTGEKNNRAIFLDRLGIVYRERNMTDQAVTTYQKLIELGGDYAARGYQGEVDTYRDAKQFDKATSVARDAGEKLPKDRAIQLMLAGQLADTGHVDEGLAIAKGLLKNTADDRDVDLALAQIYTRLRRWKEASDEIDKAEKLPSKTDDKIYIYFLRGTLQERQKHYDAAEEQFRQVLAIDPNNAQALNYLGYMLADRGVRLNDALTMVRKAVELDPQNGAYLDSLGWAYFKLGQYALAEENLMKAIERMGTDPTVHDHLGDVYEKTGRTRQAAAQWERSLDEYRRSARADVEDSDVEKVQHKLESAKVRLAKSAPEPSPIK
jgi:tetratricopeptide (TPR) repeat protein